MAAAYHESFVLWVANGDVATHALGEVLTRKVAERSSHMNQDVLSMRREVGERWNPWLVLLATRPGRVPPS